MGTEAIAQQRDEEVRLTMPAVPGLLRVARLTAAGLANRVGFTYDEIEDVKIAVDELCFVLVGSKGRDGTLELIYSLDADGLAIEGVGRFADAPEHLAPSDLSSQILKAVVDDHEVGRQGDAVRFRLRKRHVATAVGDGSA